jgi:hypothetical protein
MHFHKSIDRYNGGQTAAHIDRRYYSQGEERKENVNEAPIAEK